MACMHADVDRHNGCADAPSAGGGCHRCQLKLKQRAALALHKMGSSAFQQARPAHPGIRLAVVWGDAAHLCVGVHGAPAWRTSMGTHIGSMHGVASHTGTCDPEKECSPEGWRIHGANCRFDDPQFKLCQVCKCVCANVCACALGVDGGVECVRLWRGGRQAGLCACSFRGRGQCVYVCEYEGVVRA